jgi:hypothetical protein
MYLHGSAISIAMRQTKQSMQDRRIMSAKLRPHNPDFHVSRRRWDNWAQRRWPNSGRPFVLNHGRWARPMLPHQLHGGQRRRVGRTVVSVWTLSATSGSIRGDGRGQLICASLVPASLLPHSVRPVAATPPEDGRDAKRPSDRLDTSHPHPRRPRAVVEEGVVDIDESRLGRCRDRDCV